MSSQNISIAEASDFSMLFTGNEDAHGQYIPPKEKTETGDKQKGSSFTQKGSPTSHMYTQHLKGERGLGIIPINKDNNIRFCAIDIDVYPLDVMKYQHAVNEFELPFLIFRSKSGGAHLYLFFREDVKAEKMVPLMKKWANLFGLPENTEIFPKQKRLRTPGSGNWLNLPYFGNTRKLISPEGVELSLAEAIDTIKLKLTTFEEVNNIYKELPMNTAPPCLQSLYVMNDPGQYEMYLFNLAVYLKAARPNDWEEHIYKANHRLEDGLEQERIEKQLISQHEKKTYSYRCSEAPICDRCNKLECEGRKYGKGGEEISDFTFEDMTQILSDPPYYEWIVNGSKMTFTSEQELRDQNKFADYCMRHLHRVPNRLKGTKWVAILNKAFSEVKQVKVDLKDDISPGAIMAEYVYEFLFERARAKTREQVAQLGRVFEDEKKGMLHFRKNELIKYFNSKNFRYFGATEIQSRLKDYGARATTLYVNKRINTIRTWAIPTNMAEALGDSIYTDEGDVDFSDLVDKEKEEF